MAKSIMHSKNEGCLFCQSPYTEEHHVFGRSNRKLSEKYGLKVYLCKEHHTGDSGVHFNKLARESLQRYGQTAFEQNYPELNFREIFGKNYKGENEDE